MCKTLKNNDKDIIVEIYPINIQYKNKDKKLENREQKYLLVIGNL